MATPSTQHAAQPPRPPRGSTRSVRELINGRQHSVICISDDDDDDNNNNNDDGADMRPSAAAAQIKAASGAATRPSPAPSESGRPPTTHRSHAGPRQPDRHPDHRLRDDARRDDLRRQQASKRKRLSDAEDPSKAPRTTKRDAPASSSRHHAHAAGALPDVPAVASPYPIPPVPTTSTWKSPAWQAVNGTRPRPRAPPASGSSAVGNDAPPRPAKPVDDADGHFIVRPGENLTPRFKILSQLGQGTFGKVIECFDRTERSRVAIKVIRAVQKYRDAAQIEIRVLRTLRENDPQNENRCIHLISTFNYKNHVCIVSELLSKSVFDFLKENEFHPFPSTHIWSFAKQLLQSVAFLHSLQLIHTDLKPENILLEESDFVSKPYSSRSANSKRWKILKNTALRLIDFGSATFNDEYHSTVVSTRHYRAPEIMLGMGWSFPCDAWSIGCILIEFHTGDALFQTHNDLEHLAMMEACLGPMPDAFRLNAERHKPELFKDGMLNYPNAETSRTSQRYVRGMKKITELLTYPSAYSKHNLRFLHLLRRLLEYDPAQRISVHEALKHPYFDLSASEFPP